MQKFRGIAALGGVALAASMVSSPALAQTIENTYPETPKFNPVLPLIHTTHGSDHLKANILNPKPVCNALEDRRTVVYKVVDNFSPVGTISTTNQTKGDIPLTQDLSKSQTIGIKVNGSQTETLNVNTGGSVSKDGATGQAGIAYSLARMIGGEASYSLTWQVGQKIGPYQVPAGFTGEATYGFRTVTMTGTQQFCKSNGTWSDATPWSAFAPIKNEVRVRLYDNPADAYGGRDPKQPVNDVVEAPAPQPAAGDMTAPEAPVAHDLAARLTVAGGKVPGYAGLVALRVKNVGTDRYFAEFPQTTFRVRVKTESGPQGVDRLITPGSFNGAYTRDLGFDPKTSTRTFEVALANPIEPGEEALVANLNFGDGDTRLGRLVNRVEVEQVGRVAGDSTAYNDNVDSRKVTSTDIGKANPGLF